MAEKKTQPLTIDGVEYDFNELTDNQKIIVNHVADLDRKLASAKFNLDQLQVGRDAFFAMLKDSLNDKVEDVEPVN